MELYNPDTQEFVDVPDDQVEQALLSGTYALGRTKRINVQLHTGEYGVVDASSIFDVLRAGGRYDTKAARAKRQDKKQYGDKAAQALLLGAARGITFGLSDVALSQGLYSQEELEKIQEYNSTASTVGEIGSLLIPGLGAVRLLEKGGRAAQVAAKGAKLLPTVGAARAGGAVGRSTLQALEKTARISDRGKQAIAMGAGVATEATIGASIFAASEAALGRSEELVEELQTIGLSAGVGGLLGVGFGAIKAAPKGLADAMTGGRVTKYAEEGLAKVDSVRLGIDVKSAKELQKPDVADFVVLPGARKEQRKSLTNHSMGVIDATTKAFAALGRHAAGRAKDLRVDELAKPGFDALADGKQLIDDIAANADALTNAGVLLEYQKPIIAKISAKAKAASARVDTRTRRMMRDAASQPGINAYVFKQIDDLKGFVGENLDKHFTADFLDLTPQQQSTLENAGGFYTQMREFLEDADRFGEPLATLQREVNQPFSAAIRAKNTGLVPAFYVRAGKGVYELRDSKVNAYLNKLGDQARFDNIAEHGRVKQVDEYFSALTSFRNAVQKHYGDVPEGVDEALDLIQPFKKAQEDFATKQILHEQFSDILTNQNKAVSALSLGLGIAGKIPVPVVRGVARGMEAAISPAARLRRRQELLAAKAKAQAKLDNSVQRSIRALTDPAPKPFGREILREDFRRRLRAMMAVGGVQAFDEPADDRELTAQAVEAVQTLAQPERLAGLVERETRTFAKEPELQQAAAQRVSSTMAYLGALTQNVTFQTDPLTGDRQVLASDVELAKIARQFEALGSPLEALEQGVATGTLTNETVQTVRTMFPIVFSKFATELQSGLIDAKTTISHQQRLMLSMIMGVPMTPYMQPAFVAVMQAVHGRLPPETPQPRGYTGALAKQPERELLPLQRGLQA